MKNILFLHHTPDLGGAEVMRLMLLKHIDKSRYNVSVCFIGEKGPFGREIERLGYPVDELKQDPNSKSFYITYKLAKYLEKKKPDILHSCLFNSNFHGRVAAFLCRIPDVITEEHGEYNEYNTLKFFPFIFSDFLLSRVNRFIICCSKKVKEDIIKKEKLPRHKIVHIDNCLDIKKYIVKTPKEEIKRRYGISDETVFIDVAALKARKGHDYLIEALRGVKKEGYKFKCFFAGDGPLKGMLQQQCNNLGLSEDVIFLGRVNDIADYLNASDVFILPSFSEGNSIALMEAMLMGLAVISTNVGSSPDLIRTDFNGILIQPKDKEGLRQAILFYLKNKNLIKEFGERSKVIIKEGYCLIDRYIRHYYELWDRCVKN